MTTINGYTIKKELGSGAFGTTYLATQNGDQYAIKKFKQNKSIDLKIEKAALIAISAICNKYATCFKEGFTIDNATYMVVDYIEGVDLAKILFGIKIKDTLERDLTKKVIKLYQRQMINIVPSLVKGLYMLHSYNLIHQDIKPENLMYVGDGNVKFIDFGLSCVTHEEKTYPFFGVSLNYPCGHAGSIATTSPELFLWNTESIIYYKFVPVTDKGIFPVSYLKAHDIWSIATVLMAWYTLEDDKSEIFSVYNIYFMENIDYYKQMFENLRDANVEKYNIVVGLFDRDPISRIYNFDMVNKDNIETIIPNWDDPSVTLKARESLRQWRCDQQEYIELDFGEDCNTEIPKPKSSLKVNITFDDY